MKIFIGLIALIAVLAAIGVFLMPSSWSGPSPQMCEETRSRINEKSGRNRKSLDVRLTVDLYDLSLAEKKAYQLINVTRLERADHRIGVYVRFTEKNYPELQSCLKQSCDLGECEGLISHFEYSAQYDSLIKILEKLCEGGDIASCMQVSATQQMQELHKRWLPVANTKVGDKMKKEITAKYKKIRCNTLDSLDDSSTLVSMWKKTCK